jgi:nitrite reductase/ring-hydroxylating ferredoxin subunit
MTKPTLPADPGTEPVPHDASRRRLIKSLLGVTATVAVVGAYGAFALVFGRFFYRGAGANRWTFVGQASEIASGAAMTFRTPGGMPLNIARQGEGDDSIVALSSTCPHLGCQVRWEPHNDRFFCPCHNGVFDPSGKAISGPPADAGQSLLRFPVRIDRGLVFVAVPAQELSQPRVAAAHADCDCKQQGRGDAAKEQRA